MGSNPHQPYLNSNIVVIMKSRLDILFGIALILQGLVRDWQDWSGVLYGIAVGIFVSLLAVRYRDDH